MGAKKGAKQEDAVEDLSRDPLQAILLADSFTTKFRPITLECPKVLLPIVNTPMIDYTLTWLESAGVEKVFVFCCSHSKKIIEYLKESEWVKKPNFSVTTIESLNCISAGDALRVIYERNVINSDFILVSGDTVSNMMLKQALDEHKKRRQKDSNAIMTMVVKKLKSSQVTHQTRLGTDELIMAIDPSTKQLLYYEDKGDDVNGTLTLDKSFLAESPSLSLQNDKQDCYIDICSPEVLSLFIDNFDYQHLRRHFVKGLLLDDIMGYKIYTHEIHSEYAARIDNFRSYDSISKDIILRWTYPIVPSLLLSTNTFIEVDRNGIYRGSEISQSRSAQVGPFTFIGKGSSIGDNTVIKNSVVGDNCKIGSNVFIDGCYIWHDVTIEDGCRLTHDILCDGVVMKSGAVVEPGVVLSFKVVVGENIVVDAYSKVSLLPQPVKEDSDDELEYADNNSVTVQTSDTFVNGDSINDWDSSKIGNGGRGFIWSNNEVDHEEEWRHSVAPIPALKLEELTKAAHDDLETALQDDSFHLRFDASESESDDDIKDESQYFEKEVEETFLRAVHENVKEDHVILEVNSLRLSYNMALENCASALFYSMMKLALDTPHKSATDLVKNVDDVMSRWGKLLKPYLQGVDDEIEVIMKFEEICLESGKEYAPLFVQILHLLYDKDIIQEEAVLNWSSEKEDADESDKVFVKQAEKFIQWLNEASVEEEEEED
ncbi:translation initiation factor eIF2B subunit epsilon-like [Rutidosis leptorrhynchoides]|uniref:translation initiation factor eIF2B subunit epsilon-like n=1 Tax=Rutidosis leptorrhynchoides TaxID=125765 RepID=UPI003A98E1DD